MNFFKYLVLLVFLTGCGRVICEEPYRTNSTYYVNTDKVDIPMEYFTQAFDRFLIPLGYDFRLGREVSDITIYPLHNENFAGLTSFGSDKIFLQWNVGPEVIAHEFMHLFGVGHLNSGLGSCHLMNPTNCFPLSALTDEDIFLYQNRAIKCD